MHDDTPNRDKRDTNGKDVLLRSETRGRGTDFPPNTVPVFVFVSGEWTDTETPVSFPCPPSEEVRPYSNLQMFREVLISGLVTRYSYELHRGTDR